MQSLHGQARTLKESMEIAGPVMRGSSITLGLFRTCHRGAAHDGFTAHKRLKGKSWKTEFPPFGGGVGALNRIQVRTQMAAKSVLGNCHGIN